MAYIFESEEAATLKFDDGNKSLTINNISGTVTSAQTIINGVRALLHIGGIENRYDPEDAVRSVKQNVISET